jgi:hypothetical protein
MRASDYRARTENGEICLGTETSIYDISRFWIARAYQFRISGDTVMSQVII